MISICVDVGERWYTPPPHASPPPSSTTTTALPLLLCLPQANPASLCNLTSVQKRVQVMDILYTHRPGCTMRNSLGPIWNSFPPLLSLNETTPSYARSLEDKYVSQANFSIQTSPALYPLSPNACLCNGRYH